MEPTPPACCNTQTVKGEKRSPEEDDLLRNHVMTHGQDCTLRWTEIAHQHPRRTEAEMNKRIKLQNSDGKNPVEVRPTRISTGSSSAQNMFSRTAPSTSFLHPLVEQLLPITCPHIFPRNPTPSITLVPVPVPVLVPVPMVSPPIPPASQPPSLYSVLFDQGPGAVSVPANVPAPLTGENLNNIQGIKAYMESSPVTTPELMAMGDVEKLNAVIQQYATELELPPTAAVREQPTKPTPSCELVAPEVQFPDDITEVEPLVISPDDLSAPASSSLPLRPQPPGNI